MLKIYDAFLEGTFGFFIDGRVKIESNDDVVSGKIRKNKNLLSSEVNFDSLFLCFW